MGRQGELSYAQGHHEVIRTVSEKVIKEIRPGYEYATVQSIDRANRKATVQITGQATQKVVNMHAIQPAFTGQYVQIAGNPQDRYISYVFDKSAGAVFGYLRAAASSSSQGGALFLDPPAGSTHALHALQNTGGWTLLFAPGFDSKSIPLWIYPAAGEFPTSFVFISSKFKIGNENYYQSNRVQLATTSDQSITSGAMVDVIWHTLLISVQDDGTMWTSGKLVILPNDGEYTWHAMLTLGTMATGNYARAYTLADTGSGSEIVGAGPVYPSSSLFQPAVEVSGSGYFPAGTKLWVAIRSSVTVSLKANKSQTIESTPARTVFDVAQVRG